MTKAIEKTTGFAAYIGTKRIAWSLVEAAVIEKAKELLKKQLTKNRFVPSVTIFDCALILTTAFITDDANGLTIHRRNAQTIPSDRTCREAAEAIVGSLNLTEASAKLFVALCADAPNWSGTPMLDITNEERGNLTHLKKADLVTTFSDNGCDWIRFTAKAIELVPELKDC